MSEDTAASDSHNYQSRHEHNNMCFKIDIKDDSEWMIIRYALSRLAETIGPIEKLEMELTTGAIFEVDKYQILDLRERIPTTSSECNVVSEYVDNRN